MATTASETSPDASVAAAPPTPPKTTGKRKGAALVATPLDLHPDQRQAIRYLEFMTSETAEPVTLESFMREAIARQLTVANRSIVGFPPAMLEKLTKVGLMK